MNVVCRDERGDPPLSGELSLSEIVDLATGALTREELPPGTAVDIALVDEASIAHLNESFMGKTGPTDVLSFPIEDLKPGTAPEVANDGPPIHLGDVVICPRVAAGNASTREVALSSELSLLVVHGLLHLLGYDHVVDGEAEQMEQRERELLASAWCKRW